MSKPLVFVSYAREDDNRVLHPLMQYLNILERRGDLRLKVDTGLAPGENVDDTIVSWIEEAQIVISLLSLSYFTSDYIVETELPELRRKVARTPNLQILPLILQKCDWKSEPLFARRTVTPNEKRTFLELTDTEIFEELERFNTLLKERLASLGASNSIDQAPENSRSIGRPLYGSHVFQPEEPFGRENQKTEAVTLLENNPILLLFGAPGQGKSELARYIAMSLEERFDGGIWEVDIQNESQVDNLPPTISRSIGLKDETSPFRALSEKQHLVILDGFDLILARDDKSRIDSVFRLLINSLRNGSRIIITCQNSFERTGVVGKKVPPLSGEACVQLFHKASRFGYKKENELTLRSFLTEELGGHPYSIIIVGKYSQAIKIPFADLRNLWRQKWDELAGYDDALDRRGLATSFELSFGTLNADQRRFFLAFSMFPDGISRESLDSIWGDESGKLNDALRVFYERGLLDERLWHDSIFKFLGPIFQFSILKFRSALVDTERTERNILDRDIELVDGYLDKLVQQYAPQATDHSPAEKNRIVREQFHNIHASLDRRLVPARRKSAVNAAEAVLKLYWAYHNNMVGTRNAISTTEDAINYIERARAVFEANSKKDEVARCLHNTGSILWLRGDIERARLYLNDAISSEGCSEEMRIDCRRAFAHMEYKEGSLTRADRLYMDAARAAKNLSDETIFLKCQIGRIDVYRKLAKYDEALGIFDEIQEALSEMTPSVRGNAVRGKAYALFAKGQFNDAKRFYESALREFEGVSAFGQAHCHRGIGDVELANGQLDAAIVQFDRALELYDEAGKIPSLGYGLVNLGKGKLQVASGDVELGIATLRECNSLFSRQELNEPYEFGASNEALGEVLMSLGRYDEAHGSLVIAKSHFERLNAEIPAQRVAQRIDQIEQMRAEEE